MFKKWADRAMAVFPHLDITTCHSYEVRIAREHGALYSHIPHCWM
jgi:hypothetical protein